MAPIAEWLEKWARLRGDADAVRARDRSWTWRQLVDRGREVGAALARLGVTAGSPVMLALSNRPELASALAGIVEIGAVPVVVDRTAVESVATRLVPAAVVVDDDSAPTAGLPTLVTGPSGDRSIPGRASPTPLAEGCAYVVCSSGTTGAPKLITWSHRRVASQGYLVWRGHQQLFADDPAGGCTAIVLPLSYHFGFASLLAAWRCGIASALIDQPFAVHDAFAQMAGHRVTSVSCTPTHVRMWLEAGVEAPASLRLITVSGDAIAREQMEALTQRFAGVTVLNMYGTAETGWVSASVSPGSSSSRAASAGRPLPGRAVTVLSSDGRALPAGEIGELVLCCDDMDAADGYFDATAEESARFSRGRVVIGDRGFIDDGGEVVIVERTSDLIKVADRAVSARAIERALGELTGEDQLAVVGAPHPRYGEVPAVLYVGPHVRHRDRALRTAARGLSAAETPRWFLARSALPRTASGKIRRAQLAREVRVWSALWTDWLAHGGALWPARSTPAWQLVDVDPALLGLEVDCPPGRPISVVVANQVLAWATLHAGGGVDGPFWAGDPLDDGLAEHLRELAEHLPG